MTTVFSTDPAFAHDVDARDPLRELRSLFHIPKARGTSRDSIYLTGNSLGAQPKAARDMVDRELDDWARLGVAGHLHGQNPWLPYHEQFRAPLSRLLGATQREVVAMGTLTANLHFLMVSFYRPTRERYRIVIEDSAFPSDSYAVRSQVDFHARAAGFDAASGLVRLRPREGEETLRTEDIEAFLAREGRTVALMLLGGVNYLTGQWFDMQRLTAAGQRAGCVVGWDLAHAAGNVPVKLHDWNADFAAWCSYKYLNSGPGAVAGAFVHERHLDRLAAVAPNSVGGAPFPIFSGWWGNDPATRFRMGPDFSPLPTADAWSVSNPPILSLAPLKASLDVFDRAGMAALREKSLRLTGYMEYLLGAWCSERVRIVTPRDPHARGCQLSLRVAGAGRALEAALESRGIVVDFREPDVIRAAPVPSYNTFQDVRDFVTALAEITGAPAPRT